MEKPKNTNQVVKKENFHQLLKFNQKRLIDYFSDNTEKEQIEQYLKMVEDKKADFVLEPNKDGTIKSITIYDHKNWNPIFYSEDGSLLKLIQEIQLLPDNAGH